MRGNRRRYHVGNWGQKIHPCIKKTGSSTPFGSEQKTKQVFSLLKQIHPNSAWCCRASSLFKDKKATLKIVLSVRDVRLDTCETPIVQMKVHLIGIPDPFKMFHVILVVTIASWRGLFFPRYDIPLYCLVNRDPYFTVFFIIPT